MPGLVVHPYILGVSDFVILLIRLLSAYPTGCWLNLISRSMLTFSGLTLANRGFNRIPDAAAVALGMPDRGFSSWILQTRYYSFH